MICNLDPSKQAHEVIFRRESKQINHPSILSIKIQPICKSFLMVLGAKLGASLR